LAHTGRANPLDADLYFAVGGRHGRFFFDVVRLEYLPIGVSQTHVDIFDARFVQFKVAALHHFDTLLFDSQESV
jgi:hypothetical protein